MSKKIGIIDLFSGCGGLSYGFSMAGYETLLGIDNDKASINTFLHNHKNSQAIQEDINKISGKDIKDITKKKDIDVIIGGPPCQGFSLSGPRKFDDPRNSLYLSYIRIVKDLMPKIFLIENVPGISSLYKGQIRDEIVNRFSKLGYSIACQKINAADYGVPQLRNRFIFVGILSKSQKFSFPSPSHNTNTYITAGDAIDDLPPLDSDCGYEPAPYPKTKYLTDYQKFCRAKSKLIYNHIGTKHAEKTKNIISLVPEGGNYKDLPSKFSKTRNFHVAWTRLHSKKPSFTIDTGHRHHFHYRYNRVPTVRECARLQSFTDDFIFCGNKSQQYKQAGNAVPPLLAKALADKIKDYL